MVPRQDSHSRSASPLRRSAQAGLLLAATLAILACGGAAKESIVPSDAHIFAHEPSGVGLELPAMWAGRYALSDSITVPAAGLERELSLRLIRADSSLVSEPLLVIRVFSNAGFNSIPMDSAGKLWGSRVAQDAARTIMVRPAPGNPLTAEMPDAGSFDSLIVTLLSRQMKASLRAPGR